MSPRCRRTNSDIVGVLEGGVLVARVRMELHGFLLIPLGSRLLEILLPAVGVALPHNHRMWERVMAAIPSRANAFPAERDDFSAHNPSAGRVLLVCLPRLNWSSARSATTELLRRREIT